MKRINNNQLRLAVISLALFGLVGLCSADNAVANTPLTATSIVDFNGDGKSDVMLVDSGTAQWQSYDFYQGVLNQLEFGSPGDRQVVGDYDGDGRTDLATFRPSTGFWYIYLSQSMTKRIEQFGFGSDKLVPADYDGDSIVDISVWSSSTRVVNVLPSQSSIMTSPPVGTEFSMPVSLSVISQ